MEDNCNHQYHVVHAECYQCFKCGWQPPQNVNETDTIYPPIRPIEPSGDVSVEEIERLMREMSQCTEGYNYAIYSDEENKFTVVAQAIQALLPKRLSNDDEIDLMGHRRALSELRLLFGLSEEGESYYEIWKAHKKTVLDRDEVLREFDYRFGKSYIDKYLLIQIKSWLSEILGGEK